MIIRQEQQQDIASIREVNDLAFGQLVEGSIVDKLRERCDEFLSFVAVEQGLILGHILFTPAVLETKTGTINGLALAPMAVLPDHQCKGIGTKLANAAIRQIKDTSCPFIIVLGYPEYYQRFGFESAARYGITSEWDVPVEAFMIMILDKQRMQNSSGIAKYRPEWNDAI
jgi:putative acetyltransferase